MMLRLITGLWCLFLVVSVIFLTQLSWNEHLSTNVGDLLPEDSSAEGFIVREWVQSRQSRMVWATLQLGNEQNDAAVNRVKEYLSEHPVIQSVHRLDQMNWIEDHFEFWWQQRFSLRFPYWWGEMTSEYGGDPIDLAVGAVARLEAFLEEPDSFVWEQLLQGDPLLLIPDGIASFDRVLSQKESSVEREPVIPWMLELQGDPLDAETQVAFLQAMDEVQSILWEKAQGAKWEYSGVVRFAEANRSGITREVTWLNIAIAASVLVIMAVLLKSIKPLFVVALVITGSLLCGLTVVMLVFSQVHVLALVMGSILAGIAADYALHTSIGKHRLKSVLFPLLAGFFSTAIGYSLFLFAPLPMLQQTGLFVTGGLTGAIVSAVLLRCWITPGSPRWGSLARIGGRQTRGLSGSGFGWGALVFLVVLFGFVIVRVSWVDDLRLLEKPTPELYQIDSEVRRQVIGDADAQVIIVSGSDWRHARRNLNEFLRALPEGIEISARIWEWVPDVEFLDELERWLALNGEKFVEALMVELEQRHFDSRAFEPFVQDWGNWLKEVSAHDYWDESVASLGEVLPGLLSALFSPGKDQSPAWFSVAWKSDYEVADGLYELPGVIAFSQLSQLNQVFAGYRQTILKLAVGATGLIAVIMMLILPLRLALLAVFIPAAAVGCYLVLGSMVRSHFNLFDLIGVFLGACLALDYALFGISAMRRKEALPVSIHLSAITTSVSFFWLTASSVPAVQSLGQAVAFCVLFGWAITVVTSSLLSKNIYQNEKR